MYMEIPKNYVKNFKKTFHQKLHAFTKCKLHCIIQYALHNKRSTIERWRKAWDVITFVHLRGNIATHARIKRIIIPCVILSLSFSRPLFSARTGTIIEIAWRSVDHRLPDLRGAHVPSRRS